MKPPLFFCTDDAANHLRLYAIRGREQQMIDVNDEVKSLGNVINGVSKAIKRPNNMNRLLNKSLEITAVR
jgi:hypothetical protein